MVPNIMKDFTQVVGSSKPQIRSFLTRYSAIVQRGQELVNLIGLNWSNVLFHLLSHPIVYM